MKKKLRGLLALALALILSLSTAVSAFAVWPSTDESGRNNYLVSAPTILVGGSAISSSSYTVSGFINVYLLPAGSSDTFTPTGIEFGSFGATKDNTADLALGVEYDFSKPVRYNVTSGTGRSFPVFTMAAEATGGWSGWTQQDSDDLLAMAELIANTYIKMYEVIDEIKASSTAVGSSHPANADMLNALGWYLGLNTAYYTDNSTGQSGNRMFDSHAAVWREGGAQAVTFAREYIEKALEARETTGGSYIMKPAALRIIYEQIIPYYIDYAENTLINEPAIASYVLGGSCGRVDAAAKTITVPLPTGTDRASLADPVIKAAGWNKVSKTAGSVTGGTLAYQVTPYDLAYGTEYSTLSESWTVYITEGEPDNLVTSFAVETSEGKLRYAEIDQGNKTITLNLPEGTSLTAITPIIEHTGTTTNMDTGTVDFTNPQMLTLTNTYFPSLSTSYTVTVTAQKSDKNFITSYKIGDSVGVINGDSIAITIPYVTDLATAEPVIAVSEFANVTAEPAALVVGANSYTVAAENGTERTYTVTIARTAAATGNSILSFKYGAATGVINSATGAIALELPASTSTTFAPTITLSPFATVSPASGVAQDFSSPVKYTVTSQGGAKNTYTVTVTVSQEQVENPYKSDMETLLEGIVRKYKNGDADDDWEWMDLGFYENKLANYDDGFSPADVISGLDTTTGVAMTNIDRKIMTLTARGFDCSNLAQYNGGVPFKDKKGNDVDDLVSVLYNYSGSYTINGPAFALIALDMGNYTVPTGAKWTRENLLETLIDCSLETALGQAGLDMATMMMQSLIPYIDDSVYGERVQAKMAEALELIFDSFGTDSFGNPFGVQWGGTFTSEGAVQIIALLCGMGIDCHSDVRMNDGEGNSTLTSFLNYANYDNPGFHHTPTVRDNAMATYQGCYGVQWYLGFLENGGAGHSYSLYYNRFDFSRKLSTDASITEFELEGKQGVITEAVTEGGQNTIEVTLPTGTPLTSMYPIVTLTEGATMVAPDLSRPVTFIKDTPQPFTVKAEDGETTKTYYVTVKLSDDVTASGAELFPSTIKIEDGNILRDLDILSTKVTEGETYTDIELSVNAGVDTAAILIKADISYGATATPALDGKKKTDLTDWTDFTIVSADGANTNVYRIKVTPKTQASIAAFTLTIGGTLYNGVIDDSANTITISGVDDSSLTTTKFAPDVTLGPDTLVCSPTSGLEQDFSKTVSYIASGGEGVVARTYTVSVLNKEGKLITSTGGSSEPDTPTVTGAKITSFTVLDVAGVIDHDAGTITVTLPFKTDTTKVAPVVQVASGAVVSPVSGEVVNLANGITYTVTNGEETKKYEIFVILEKSVSDQLWDKVAGNNTITDHQVSYDSSILSSRYKR